MRPFFTGTYQSTIYSNAYNEPPGNHFIDIDAYPIFQNGVEGAFPRSLTQLNTLYGASTVNNNGISPWTIADYRTSLTSLMRTARTTTDWQNAAVVAGQMAHYIEDINNPLHTTKNYNGQLSGNTGIHSRYETTMVNRWINSGDLTIIASPGDVVYVAGTVDYILDSIELRTYSGVATILAADTAAGKNYNNTYYNTLWSRTGDMTKVQFQDASEMVASLWYSAWVDAGSPNLGVTVVPEPAAVLPMYLGAAVLLCRRR